MKRSGREPVFAGRPSPALFIVVAVLVPALLAAFALWLDREYSRIDREREVVERTADRNASASAIIAFLRQAETAQRGYVLTRDGRFLEPYEPARRQVAGQMRNFVGSAAGSAVEELVGAKFAEMDQVLDAARRGDWSAAAARISDGEGLALMGRIDRLLTDEVGSDSALVETGRNLFVERTVATQRTVWILIAVLSAGLLVGLALLWKYRLDRWAAAVSAQEALTRHKTILDSTSDAIIICNPSGTIEQLNAAALSMLGYRAEDLLQRDVARILDIAPGDGTFHQRIGLEDGELATRQLVDRVAVASDGTAIPVDVALGVMQVPDGVHLVASVRDISGRKEVERMKDEFVATVSHELRTPLTSVVGSLGLLRAGTAGQLPEPAQELVAIAENNTRRLIRLTNDILDLEKLHSGAMIFTFGAVDLGELAREAAHEHRALAAARGVTLRVVPAPEPQIVKGDRQRLMQVVGNLLANAIRHTRDGTEVTIEVVPVDGRATMRVADKGPGVPMEYRDRIFDRFAQAPSDHASGSGLGLAISREIIARHDGAIWCEPSPSGGAAFVFALRRLMSRAEQQEWLLAVCDHVETMDRLAAMAGDEGVDLRKATTPEALEELLANPQQPMLVLFDMDMQTAKRNELCAILSSYRTSRTRPMALISSRSLGADTALPVRILEWSENAMVPTALVEATKLIVEPDDDARPLILHVEDDHDVAAITASALSADGEVEHAASLAAARALLRKRRPAIVLLDLALPDGSGLELLPELIDESGRPIPTIVHSAQDLPGPAAVQISAVLVKSRHSLPDLQATVRAALALREAAP